MLLCNRREVLKIFLVKMFGAKNRSPTLAFVDVSTFSYEIRWKIKNKTLIGNFCCLSIVFQLIGLKSIGTAKHRLLESFSFFTVEAQVHLSGGIVSTLVHEEQLGC